MIEGVCRVCGAALSAPLVHCPQCATPHHSDCWEYNRGCAIYGCTQAESGQARSGREYLPEPADAPRADDPNHDFPASLLGVAAALGGCILFGPLHGLVLGLATKIVLKSMRKTAVEEPSNPDAHDQAMKLEVKAVRALIGTHAPQQLAQVYALFEQRHPRSSLPQEAQRALAVELLDSGFLVLGLEALDKGIRGHNPAATLALQRRRKTALLQDPAFLEEALAGMAGTLSWTEHAFADQMPLFAEAGERALALPQPHYLLSGTARGWGYTFEETMQYPWSPDRRHRSMRVAGPLTGTASELALKARLEMRFPALVVPERALSFSDRYELIHELHLSQSGARFVLGPPMSALGDLDDEDLVLQRDRNQESELECGWDEIASVFFGRLESTRVRSEQVREEFMGPRVISGRFRTVNRNEVESRPVLELTIAGSGRRLRIDSPTADLYAYLGRRKEYSHAFNLTLVVKDIVRFAPVVRASHGVHGLFGEQLSTGMRFADSLLLEDYLLWFHTIGSEDVRTQWVKLGPQLDQSSPLPARAR